ncbi:MAG TPA: NADH-quinone oxidoreductase subunit M, partial [Gemmataceae bacterium]|nr:NADH-quinone oxidoreductase subunit M [Gemmataceae bacterium]
MNNFEFDLVLMSLVIFVPSLFAILLLFVPPGKEEWMKWLALLGTAVTLALSLVMFNDYYHYVADFDLSNPANSLLTTRVEKESLELRHSDHDWIARRPWIAHFGIDYYLGVDGISMPLVLLTTVLSFLAMIASWNINRMVRGYCILFLILETGMVGTFLALDFFLFYIFWEVMLLPMYFLIGVWGGPRREYAAIKFFLYTLLGSVFILIAMLAFYFTDVRDFVRQDVVADRVRDVKETGPRTMTDVDADARVKVNTFDLVLLQKAGRTAAEVIKGKSVETDGLRHAQSELEAARRGGNAATVRTAEAKLAAAQARLHDQSFFTPAFQVTMFLLLLVGFAIKVPVFPFHTWLPDAHVEAPTPISMILAGVLLKMGGYGIIRIAYPICPWAAESLAWWVSLFGIINIVYGAFAAMAQTDFKKLVAYSSISHMGYVILGIAVWSAGDRSQYWSWGMNGAMFQMIAHGITSAGMFFLVGVIYDRAHHRNLDNFRGLYEPMPLYGGISALIFFAAMGLPGMCGFVGEFMVVLSTWNYSRLFAILAALTVVIT